MGKLIVSILRLLTALTLVLKLSSSAWRLGGWELGGLGPWGKMGVSENRGP